MLAILLSTIVAAQPVPADFARYPACARRAELIEPCIVSVQITAAAALRLVGHRDWVWWQSGNQFTMIARPTSAPWVMFCCSLQTGLDPIPGTDLAATTIRVPHLDEAIIDIEPAPSKNVHAAIFRGLSAPPAPPRIAPLLGSLTSHDFTSPNLGENRRVWFYVPPETPTNARLPVVYLADAMAKTLAPVVEALIGQHRIQPIILVGIEAASSLPSRDFAADGGRRASEYEIGRLAAGDWTKTNFGRHMKFVTDEVIPYVDAHLPASAERRSRTVAGASAGGDWAGAAGEAAANLFGNVIALSGTGAAFERAGELKNSRIFTGAGRFENGRFTAMKGIADKARAAHADAKFCTLWAGHSELAWDILFSAALEWLYAPNAAISSGLNCRLGS